MLPIQNVQLLILALPNEVEVKKPIEKTGEDASSLNDGAKTPTDFCYIYLSIYAYGGQQRENGSKRVSALYDVRMETPRLPVVEDVVIIGPSSFHIPSILSAPGMPVGGSRSLHHSPKYTHSP